MEKTKVIAYRGGVVSFELPAAWVEEYEEQGGGTFFMEGRDSGTLRLSVLTLEATGQVVSNSPLEALRARGYSGTAPVSLPGGNALLRYVTHAVEGGIHISTHHWQVASAVPPEHLRIAIFSFTVRAGSESTAPISSELAFLERSLPAARFAPTLGVVNAV